MLLTFKTFTAAFVLVFVVGQTSPPVTKESGNNVVAELSIPSSAYQVEPFSQVDFTIKIPTDAQGLPYIALQDGLTKDAALNRGVLTVKLVAPDTITGQWIAPADTGHTGKIGELVFRCARVTGTASITPVITWAAKNKAGTVIPMGGVAPNSIVITGQKPTGAFRLVQ
jgi:hypothetical protein